MLKVLLIYENRQISHQVKKYDGNTRYFRRDFSGGNIRGC